MKILVSIIIPVYNVETYIADCIHSLLNQTLNEIEVIVVDDKGSDKSMDIVRNLQVSHPRGEIIKIVEMPQNSRAGMARNAGIEIAQGEYLGFVDSDDWAEATMYEELYTMAKKEDSDVCFCNAIKEYTDGKTSDLTHVGVEAGDLSDKKRKNLLIKYVTAFWAAVYKRSVWDVHHIRFPVEKYEDSFIAPLVIVYAKRFSYIKRGLYHYMIREHSICTTVDDTKYKYKLQLFNKLISTLKDRNLYERYKSEFDYIYIKKAYLTAIMNYVANSKKPEIATIVSIRNEVDKIIPDYSQNKYYRKSIIVRGVDLLFTYFPNMSIILYKFYAKRKRRLD